MRKTLSGNSRKQIVVLTVGYHSQEPLADLAENLSQQTCRPSHWLVINNSPESCEALEISSKCDFSIIKGKEGDGFGSGCNIGLDFLETQGWDGWVWLLNPDTVFLEKETLEHLQSYLDTVPANAFVGTAVINKSGNLENSAGWIDPGLNFRARRVNDDFLGAKELRVDWLSGCSMLFRPCVHSPKPRFDESLPLYYEDMDLCMRFSKKGIPIVWSSQIKIGHFRGEGSLTSGERRLRLSSCSYIRYLKKHFSGWVVYLRMIRLIGKAFLLLLFRPSHSLAIFKGCSDAMNSSIK